MPQGGRQQRRGEEAIDPVGDAFGLPAGGDLTRQLLSLALDTVPLDLVAQLAELVQQSAQVVQFGLSVAPARRRDAIGCQKFIEQIPQRRQALIEKLSQRLVHGQGLRRRGGGGGMPPHEVRCVKRQLVAQLDCLAKDFYPWQRLFVRGFGFTGDELLPSFGKASQHRPAIDSGRDCGVPQNGGQRQDFLLEARGDFLRLEGLARPETLLVAEQRLLILAPQMRGIVGG